MAELGDRLVAVGNGGVLMVNLAGLEGAPVVFTTVILAVPGEATRLAGTAAVNWVALLTVVESVEEFQRTEAPAR